MTIGERIKEVRIDRGLTQEDLAIAAKTTKQTIYKYENNIVTNIPSDKIEAIADCLGVTAAYLMGWTVPNIPQPTLDAISRAQVSFSKIKESLPDVNIDLNTFSTFDHKTLEQIEKAAALYGKYLEASPDMKNAVEVLLKANIHDI